MVHRFVSELGLPQMIVGKFKQVDVHQGNDHE